MTNEVFDHDNNCHFLIIFLNTNCIGRYFYLAKLTIFVDFKNNQPFKTNKQSKCTGSVQFTLYMYLCKLLCVKCFVYIKGANLCVYTLHFTCKNMIVNVLCTCKPFCCK